MTDRDDLIQAMADAPNAGAELGPGLGAYADAIIAAGWVSRRVAEKAAHERAKTVHQAAHDDLERLQASHVKTIEAAIERYHRATDARDALAATLQRVKVHCADPPGHLDDRAVRVRYQRIRAYLDEVTP